MHSHLSIYALLSFLVSAAAYAQGLNVSGPTTLRAVNLVPTAIDSIEITPDGLVPAPDDTVVIDLFAEDGQFHINRSLPGGIGPGEVSYTTPAILQVTAPLEAVQTTFSSPVGLWYEPFQDAGTLGMQLALSAAVGDEMPVTAFIPVVVHETRIEAWRASHFDEIALADSTLEASLWGNNAAPAGDDIANLLKFNVGVGPFDKAFQRLPSIAVMEIDGVRTPLIRFARRADARGLRTTLVAGNGLPVASSPEPIPVTETGEEPLDVGIYRVSAVPESFPDIGFFQLKVEEEAPVDPPPNTDLMPVTQQVLDDICAILDTFKVTADDPNDPAVRRAIRDTLRGNLGVSYNKPLGQTLTLPEDCEQIATVTVVTNDGSIIHVMAFDPPIGPGQGDSASKSGIDGNTEEFFYDYQGGTNPRRLAFVSEFANRFRFKIECIDGSGERSNVEIECPGTTNMNNGDPVEDGDPACPSAGTPVIYIGGIDTDRFEGIDNIDLTGVFRKLVFDVGGLPKTESIGSAPECALEKSPRYYYGCIQVQQTDISAAELESRLNAITGLLGATVTRDGNLIKVVGDDADGKLPHHFLGPHSKDVGF